MTYPTFLFNGRIFHKIRRRIKKRRRGRGEGGMGREGNHLFLMRKMPFCGGWKGGRGKEGWNSEQRITMNVHRIHCTETFFPHLVQLLRTVMDCSSY
jgi:hypothetical protein